MDVAAALDPPLLYELPFIVKEETMDSTDSALDEIMISILYEFLSVHTGFSIKVDFFHLGIQLKFSRPFAGECYNLLSVIFERNLRIFSTYEEFQGKLSEIERATYSKYSIVKEHKGFPNRSK